jgi:alkylation response protein AidB-like acyl-CoA dehydrogenase
MPLWQRMGRVGLLGIAVDEDHGGSAMGYLAHAVAMEEISRASAAVGLSSGAYTPTCLLNEIDRMGSAEQKARYLPKLRAERRARGSAGDERALAPAPTSSRCACGPIATAITTC